MKQTELLATSFVALMGLASFGAELVVGPSGTYPTIQKAVNAAKAGDTITVRAGTYAGFKVDRMFEGAPLTIQAAKGERVIVSGFEKVTGWQDAGNGVYTAKVSKEADSLFVGYREQQCARWPEDGTRLPVLTANAATRTFKTTPVDDPRLKAIANDPMDAVCFYYFGRGNCFGAPRFESYDAQTGDITFGEKQWNRWITPEKNAYSFMNHPALVTKPGTWAFAKGTIFFKPEKKEDLAHTQCRAHEKELIVIAHWKNRAGNVIIDGLEITGSRGGAVRIGGDHVTIRNCVVHHNGGGIGARCVKDVKITDNIVLANDGTGISLASADGALIAGNEVAFDQIDGIVVAGNISGRKAGTKGANPETGNVVVRNNYIHHHAIQSHPDNTQFYRGVSNVVYEANFNIWGGQSIMAEEAENFTIRNNVFMGSGAVMLICGHGNSHRWTFENDTLWGAGYGFFSLTGRDYEIARCLLIGGGFPRNADKVAKIRDNKLIPSAESGNMPRVFACASANGNARDSVRFRKQHLKFDFQAGDKVELNGDGKLREVKSFANGILTFAPALDLPPFRDVLIFNWKNATSTLVDVPRQDGIGSTISTVGYVNGDLYGKGSRTLPVLPDDVKEGIPDPNRLVIPPHGH